MESKRPKSLAFIAEGTLLVANKAGLQIVDADTGEAGGTLWDHVDRDQAFAFSSDGMRVALSNEKSILIHSWAKVAAQADKEIAPILGGGTGTALKAELVANTDTYDLDLGGKTAEQFSSLPWPDRSPPTVDLSFRLRNMGSQPVSVRVWDNEEVYGVYLLGEGAFNYSWFPQTGISCPRDFKTVILLPADSFSFPV